MKTMHSIFTAASSVTRIYESLGKLGASFWSSMLTVRVVVSDAAAESLTITVISTVRSAVARVS